MAGLGSSPLQPARPVLSALGVRKSFPAPGGPAAQVDLFRDLDLEVAAGERVAIVGRSGAGKSSLLHLLAGLDLPSAGTIEVAGRNLAGLDTGALAAFRNRNIGYVWQFHFLQPEFSALENVAMPLLARGVTRQDALSAARSWLERVGLEARLKHRPGELSGGEQQRVAVARALSGQPRLVLADEPTGDLDDTTGEQLFGLLSRLCVQEQLAAVIVTHNQELARHCDRVLRLSEGRLQPA